MEAQGLSLAVAVEDDEGLLDVGHNLEIQGYQEDERSPSSSGQDEEEDDDGEGDEAIAQFLEAEVMDGAEDNGEDEEIGLPSKKRRTEDPVPIESIESGEFGKIPPELFPNILKFLSSEDLSSCARVCQYLRRAASDEPLWMRLYCLRWGLPGDRNPRGVEWKQLYFERDRADMVACLRNSPTEFREYYMQMQVAKRSQTPTISQLKDDLWVAEQSVADQVTAWRRSRRLADIYVGSHSCSGETCSYHQIGDVYICEKTGCAHVCGDACRETVIDPNCFPVCTVSGRCFDRCTFPVEEEDEENEPQQAANEEGEPMLFTGRLGRAYLLGYSCVDDREFERALRDVVYCT